MAHQNFEDIITVEKEIQEKLDAETKKAAAWANQQKEEIERESQQQIESLQSATCLAQDEVQKEAAKKCGEIIEDEERKAQQLNELTDEFLKPIVLRHIECIDPGKTP